MRNNYKPFSMHLNPELFQPATAEEKAYISTMRPSTTFFKDRWSKSDRNAGLVNYIMGLSFISEGAIPFAAADPLRVIPSCVVGSAVTGALTMAFDCTLRAPHGGIFVVPTIGNPLMYLVSILVGAVVGCVILSILKNPLKNGEDK